MTSAALIAAITLAAHNGLPLVEAMAPPLLQLPQANAEAVLLQELNTYRNFAARKNNVGMTAIRVHITGQSSAFRPAVNDLLAPLFACRTPFECSLATALIKAEIHRRPQ